MTTNNTTKIVINACYGGFSLSTAGAARYLQLKGTPTYGEYTNGSFGGLGALWLRPEGDPQRERFQEIKRETHFEEWNALFELCVWCDSSDIDRADPALAQTVEELGKAANGMCAKLVVRELEKGTLYRITEYDGFEDIETQGEIDWNVA